MSRSRWADRTNGPELSVDATMAPASRQSMCQRITERF